jgi:sulfur-oxidizing protein SoxY
LENYDYVTGRNGTLGGCLSCGTAADVRIVLFPRRARETKQGAGENRMTAHFNRRQALAVGAGALAAATLGMSASPASAANNAQDLIKAFTGGKQPAEGKVKLDLPEIAENGNTVPMTVSVDSPMTEQSHVTDVLVLADGNPNAGVATFHFSPASGVAEANTRIRLATSQNIIAVAKMNDGTFHIGSKPVKVTIGGCGG